MKLINQFKIVFMPIDIYFIERKKNHFERFSLFFIKPIFISFLNRQLSKCFLYTIVEFKIHEKSNVLYISSYLIK